MKVQLELAKEKGINVKVTNSLHNEKQSEDSNTT